MSVSRIYAIFLRQLFLFKSNPTRLFGAFIWMVLAIVQWGFISKYLGAFGQATFGFVTVILGAIILWEFMGRFEHGLMMAFLEDVWTQNFVNFFASPLKIYEYLVGLVLASLSTGLTGLIVMMLLAGLAFGYNIFKVGLLLVPYFLILLLFGIALGFFSSGLIFRLGPSAEWLGWPIPIVLSIFSGVFYPISTLPVGLQFIARALPPAYVFESMRGLLATGVVSSGLAANLFVGALLSAAYLLAAYFFFIKVYRHNLKTGGITRFGVESAY